MKFKKALSDSIISFKKIDKIVSNIYLYYASTFGFIFGWVVLGLLSFSIIGSVPPILILLLRTFYFLLSFLFGLKLTIWIIEHFKRDTS